MNVFWQICIALLLILVLIIITLPAGVVMMLCLIFNYIADFFKNMLQDIANYLSKISHNITHKDE